MPEHLLITDITSIDTSFDVVTYSTPLSLTYSGIRPNKSIVLAGNILISLSGTINGSSGIFEFTQNGAGGWTATINGTLVSLDPAPTSKTLVGWIYDGTTFAFDSNYDVGGTGGDTIDAVDVQEIIEADKIADTVSLHGDYFEVDGNNKIITKNGNESEYVISTVSGTVYAKARSGSGLTSYSGTDAYTVIQAAITALTPAGAVGSGGGKILITKGTYSLTNELIIAGWEASGGPYSQLVIEGEGLSTWLFQATSAKNALVIKNKACFGLKNIKISSSTRSALLLASDGADTEMSCFRSYIDNVNLSSSSSTHPAVYLINFMNLNVGYMDVGNPNYHGVILENASTTEFYGNSSFAHLKLFVSAAHAGLLVQSTNTTRWIDHITFQYFECGQGLYGIRTSYAQDLNFLMVDIEQVTNGISFGTLGAGASNKTLGCTVLSGYILPLTGGTAIRCSAYAGANTFRDLWIDGDSTSIPISDSQEFLNPNVYDLNLGYNINTANISITSINDTYLAYRSNFDYTNKVFLPVGTVLKPRIGTTASSATPTPTAGLSDQYNITALAANAVFAAPTGIPRDGQKLLIRITSDASIRTLGWNAIYRASSGLALPTATVASKTMYVKFIYNSLATKWDLISVVRDF